MRITNRQLRQYLDYCSQSQLDCDVSVEIDDEVFYADFDIAGPEHGVLDTNHPIIMVKYQDEMRATEEDFIKHIDDIHTQFGEVGDSIEDEDEILRRDHKNGLYGDE